MEGGDGGGLEEKGGRKGEGEKGTGMGVKVEKAEDRSSEGGEDGVVLFMERRTGRGHGTAVSGRSRKRKKRERKRTSI
jgi:hypothetical protein